jgi:hypothetical protein
MMMGGIVFFIFMILFLLFVFGLFSMTTAKPPQQTQRTPARTRGTDSSRQRPAPRAASGRQHHPAATQAMRRAGYESSDAYVRVVDIGLLAYRELDEPRLVRYNDVRTDTRYLRPFVGLSVPHPARGTVRMELRDNDDRMRYVDETRYDLDAGSNTLLPGTWLPLPEYMDSTRDWTLHVTAGETLLAVHRFGWQQVGEELRQYIQADGEISPELQDAIDQQASQGMSLSQLLSNQDT